MHKTGPDDTYPAWMKKSYRTPVDFRNKFMGKTREEYIAAFKSLGFTDICECEFRHFNLHEHLTSKDNEVATCTKCDEIIWPHNHIFECDECCEYTVSMRILLPLKEPFYCEFCS